MCIRDRFSTAYLPGFLADKYEVSVENSRERADKRCAGSLVSALESTVSNYTTCKETSRDICLKRGKVPVSYTHLDVYKRQVEYRNCKKLGEEIRRCFRVDVYKRQP